MRAEHSRDDIAHFVDAAIAGNVALINAALDSGLDPNRRCARGWTPLIGAARSGQAEVVRILLSRGASPHVCNPRGTTPIMYAKTHAFASGDFSALALLLEAGADINAQDSCGLTVLDYVEQRSRELISWLASSGAQRAPRP